MNIEISPRAYESYLNWEDGMLYCSLLVIDGKDDWRMPTIEELNDIYNSDKEVNDMYNSENDFEVDCYWSSLDDGKLAWLHDMWGRGRKYMNKKTTRVYVRAVRSINYEY